jgi:S-(hydroxymethyl)glutathione dehydrogenase / alcohol dehydrogenase
MKTKAAILIEQNKPLEITHVTIPVLKEGQVLVKMAYSGICRTQLLEWQGMKGADPYLPHLLGHEGSGMVIDVGPGVTKVTKDDHVICSWMKGSGKNVPGTTYLWEGKTVNAGGITTFQEMAVISENRLTPIDKSFSLKSAALIGCAAATGLGVVFNTLKAEKGKSIAIFGCGGIGLCALQGAVIAGCHPIVAIDTNPARKEIALSLGATDFIDLSSQTFEEGCKDHPPFDYAIEASGNPKAMETALSSVRGQGGTAVIVGNSSHTCKLSLSPHQFNQGKKLLGTWGGDNEPDKHFITYCQWISDKKFQSDSLLDIGYNLDQINEALTQFNAGKCLRPYLAL